MTGIEVRGVTVEREGHLLLDRVDLSADVGERVVLLGPSGSGKTTLLRVLAGLEPVSAGQVTIGTHDVTTAAPRDRDVAFVDQRASLQPHLDVHDNLAFALRLRQVPRAQVEERVGAQSRIFSLRSLLPRRPRTLAAGERHEVALARSLLRRVSALLMDEPLIRIDPVRRGALIRELVRMQEGYGVTLVVATNDQRVAMSLAHRIAVLSDGQVVQVGEPATLYRAPASLFVAGFLGSPPMNLLDGTVTRIDGRPHLRAEPLTVPLGSLRLAFGTPVVAGVRPHHLDVEVASGRTGSRCRVEHLELLGADVTIHLRSLAGRRLTAVVPRPGPAVDTVVHVTVRPDRVHVFDPVTERAITHGR